MLEYFYSGWFTAAVRVEWKQVKQSASVTTESISHTHRVLTTELHSWRPPLTPEHFTPLCSQRSTYFICILSTRTFLYDNNNFKTPYFIYGPSIGFCIYSYELVHVNEIIVCTFVNSYILKLNQNYAMERSHRIKNATE